MKEAIGGTWLFQLVIFFVLLFVGFVCLSINYTRAFDVKDKIINEVERNGGFKESENFTDDYVLNTISEYMKKVGYRSVGPCSSDEFDVGCDRNGKCVKPNKSTKYSYCLKEIKYDNSADDKELQGIGKGLYGDHQVKNEFFYLSYYRVRVFYTLDLPIMNQFFTFNINGDTKTLYRIANRKK